MRHSILVDSGATLLMYGMGETSIIECANWVADGMNPAELPKNLWLGEKKDEWANGNCGGEIQARS